MLSRVGIIDHFLKARKNEKRPQTNDIHDLQRLKPHLKSRFWFSVQWKFNGFYSLDPHRPLNF